MRALAGMAAWVAAAWAAVTWVVAAWWSPVAGYALADHLIAGGASPQRLAALAVAVLAVALVGSVSAGASFVRALAGVPLAGRATALREKSWHVAFLRQRDPDAAGRPRPRAPGTALAAA
jgi:hypothetical protein